MTEHLITRSPATYARLAGMLYLAIAVIAAFSIGYVPSTLIVAGDAATTTANLMAQPGLFAMGLAGDVAIMLIEIALSVMLYMLLKPVSPTLALIAMIARLAEVMVMATNVLIHVMPMLLLSRLEGAPDAALQDLVMLFMDAHAYGIFIWDIFFGFSLAVLGVLVIRSGYLPALLGGAMLVGSLGYMLEGLSKVTFVENDLLGMAIIGLLVIATIGELAFAFWLLIKGPNTASFKAALNRAALA